MKKVIALMMTLMMLVVLTGCSSGPATRESMVGTWECKDASQFLNAMMGIAGGITGISLPDGMLNAVVLTTFYPNGTFIMEAEANLFGVYGQRDTLVTGTYDVVNGELQMWNGETGDYMAVKPSGKTFVMEERDASGRIIRLTFKKR